MSLKKILNLKNTLLFRLTILYAGIFTISAIMIFTIIYFKIYSVALNEMDEEFLFEINKYSRVMDENGLEGLKTEIEDEAESEDPNEEFYRIITFDGKVLVSTDMTNWDTVKSYGIPEEIRNGKTEHVFETLDIHALDLKARVASAVITPETVFQMGETLEEAEEYFQIFINWFLLLSIIVVFLSALIGWHMARRALRGMESVTQTAMEISNGEYGKRVEVKDRFDEIKRLGDTFNKMLDQIHTLLRSMREVNDNIAHDLRSPLARIRGIAEMILMKDRSVDEYRSMAMSTIEECDNLIDIFNTMLDITEIESGSGETTREDVDLVRLIRNACELFSPIADEKRISLIINMPIKLNIVSDRKKLQRIVSNFLDNAIKYTSEGGTVTVSLSSDADSIQMIFEDSGIGISEADLPHIFERFYRCDTSRSQQGVGLGLSLVRALAESMNGFISVDSSVNSGSKFTVNLPRDISTSSSHHPAFIRNKDSESIVS